MSAGLHSAGATDGDAADGTLVGGQRLLAKSERRRDDAAARVS